MKVPRFLISHRKGVLLTGVWLACLTFFHPTIAQTQSSLSNKPIKIIAPAAPGGILDLTSRLLGEKLSAQIGRPVIVENRPGGNGNIGTAEAARATADGYTLLMATSSHAINASLYKGLSFNFAIDFTPLSNLAFAPLLLVVNPSLKANTVKEFAEYVRQNPQKLNYGSGGVGTAAHLAGELFNSELGAQMTHVAYKGGTLATNDLVGGQIQLMFANLPEAIAQVKGARLKALAVTGEARSPQAPDVPTFTESGYPQINLKSWFGLFALTGTPAAIVTKLSSDIAAVVAQPDIQNKFRDFGTEPIGNSQAAFQTFLRFFACEIRYELHPFF
jgi:tripartite-type tricarboxylate transporter receptor subunit TctC